MFVSFEDPIVGRVEEFLFSFFLKSNFMVTYGYTHTNALQDGRTSGDCGSQKSINDLLTIQFYERRLVRYISVFSLKKTHIIPVVHPARSCVCSICEYTHDLSENE